jgi:hypothetical protein
VARELTDLEAAGVLLAPAPLTTGPVFENVESPAGRRQHCLASSDAIPMSALPPAWTSGAAAVLLAPVAGELEGDWAAIGSSTSIVALGWQGLLRTVRAGEDVRRVVPADHPLVRAASLIGVSRDDLEPGADPMALAQLLSIGATLVVTDGLSGGEVWESRPDRSFDAKRYDAIPSDVSIDPTGAGDVFLAAMLAARLDPSLGDPTLVAAAAASLVVERAGLDGVPDRAAVRRRMTRPPRRASRCPSPASSRASGRPSQA